MLSPQLSRVLLFPVERDRCDAVGLEPTFLLLLLLLALLMLLTPPTPPAHRQQWPHKRRARDPCTSMTYPSALRSFGAHGLLTV